MERKHTPLVPAQVEAAQGLPFLRELKKRWDDHVKSTQMIRDILMVRRSAVGGWRLAGDGCWLWGLGAVGRKRGWGGGAVDGHVN